MTCSSVVPEQRRPRTAALQKHDGLFGGRPGAVALQKDGKVCGGRASSRAAAWLQSFIVGVCLGCSGVVSAAGDAEHGREVYGKWCAPCHAPGPEHHPGTEALAAKYKGEKPAVLAERTDLTVKFTKQMVRNGVSIMPFFRKTEISDADLDALGAYLTRKE